MELRVAGASPPEPAAADHCDQFADDATADAFTCPQGQPLTVHKPPTRRGQPTTVDRAPATACAACPVRAQCTSDQSGGRTIEVHRQYAKIRRMKERLRSAAGQALSKQRKSTVEPVVWAMAAQSGRAAAATAGREWLRD